MVDSVAPQNLPVIEGIVVVSPLADRYALKINQDGSINVTGSSGANPSVGTNGATAPTSSTEVGWIDGTGKLQGVSAANPLPISGSFSASFSEPVLNVIGTATSAAVLTNFPLNPTTGYRTVMVQLTTLTAGNTVVAEESNDGVLWAGVQTTSDTVVQSATPLTAAGEYLFPVSALQFRLRVSVFASGTATANCEFRQNPPPQQAVVVRGTPTVSVGNFPATQSVSGTVTDSNFPATVDTNAGAAGASTIRVITATNAPVQLQAGTAIAGKFGIDQTTPGTTNAVQVIGALPAGTALLGKVGIDQTTPGTTNGVQVTAALPAGTALLGKTGIDQTTPGTTNAVAPDVSGFVSGAANTTGATSVSLITAVAAKRIYLANYLFSNTSATPITVNLQDGSGGATLLTMIVPAGGGNNLGGNAPIVRTTAGNGLFFQASSGVSTLYANGSGFSQ